MPLNMIVGFCNVRPANCQGSSLFSTYAHQLFAITRQGEEAKRDLTASVEFVQYFLDSGLKIKDFIIIMRVADHRLKPDGVHTGKGRGGRWNEEWNKFMKKYPAKNTKEHQGRVKNKLEEMKKKYKIDEKTLLLPTRPDRR